MLRSSSLTRRLVRQQPSSIRVFDQKTSCWYGCHQLLYFSTNSPLEDHERRVATAQALVRERRQKHGQKISLDHTLKQNSKNKRKRNHEETTLVNNVNWWLKRDPSFFSETMKALNVSSVEESSKDHPMQVVMDQYQKLYYDSIPTFRDQLWKGEGFQEDFLLLENAGFSDPKWAKKYRKVRGYRVKQGNMKRQVERLSHSMEEKQQAIRMVQAEMDNLYHERDSFAEIRQRRLEKAEREQQQADSSLFSKAWCVVTNLFLPLSVNGEKHTSKTQEQPEVSFRIPTKSRIEKRVNKKEWDIKHLQQEVEEMSERLLHVQKQQTSRPSPMSQAEYDPANRIVERVRQSVCEKLAQHIRQRHETLIQQFQTLDSKTDLTKPHEWYSYARLDRRKIIFHGGPTNSGKTYSALQRLKEAKNGLYLGPLRLLAAEVYETLTIDGLYTNLFTGQERREIPFSTHAAATVEMCSTEKEYDVVVMDEIQMISDEARGAAWTRALLGLRCKEIHVCGGWEAKDIVEKIAKACGDNFESERYERFSKLEVETKSLSNDPTQEGAYKHVQPGDCVVAFSRNDIFAIKREIETSTNYKCCVIYGKLPPQTRADQARLFNDPDSPYQILVASDAIGMGLNLNIRRIIFNSIFKFNGESVVKLSHSDVKQISGRAGRRNSPYPNGVVSCRDPRDLPYIHECLTKEIKPIKKAGLLPTAAHIELFSDALGAYNLDDDHTNLHQILRQFSAMATVRGDFFLCRQTEMRVIAKRLKQIPIPLRDAYTMCLSPTTENSMKILENFAWKYSQGQVSGLPSRSVPKKAKSFDDLSYLCGLYSDADLFLWLQLKFPPSNAVECQTALARKETTLEYINEALAKTESLKLNHSYIRQATKHRLVWEAENASVMDDDGRNDGDVYDDYDDDSSSDDDEYQKESAA